MLPHTEDIPNRDNISKNQLKQSKINNSMISKVENYVDQKFDEAAMKYLNQNILSDIKQKFPTYPRQKTVANY